MSDKMTQEELIKQALANPRAALEAIDRVDCEESLITFIQRAWHTIEPGTPFTTGWAVDCMAEHLEAVTRGEIKRLLINVPPGCTKSVLVNTFWPAWEWGPKGLPHHRFISASYERGLATRDMIRCRDIILDNWYQARWPMGFKDDQSEKMFYANKATGWRFASSVGGRLTGYRGDRIIIDDPHDTKGAESDVVRATATRWFTETLPTRLNKADESAMVMIMQRLHVQDLSGVILDKMGDKWVHLVLPMECELKNRSFTQVPSNMPMQKVTRVKEDADPVPYYIPDDENGTWLYPQDPRTKEGELLWPERFSRNAVDDLKLAFRSGDGGSYAESGQLQQRPVNREGGMFKRDDFHLTSEIPHSCRWVRGWDLAATKDKRADWTVGVKLGIKEGVIFIWDVVRFKGTPHEVETKMRQTAVLDGHGCYISVPQDPGQAGKSQKARLAQVLHGYNVHFSTESGDKDVRATPIAAQSGAGNVYVREGAHWLPAFLAEAGLFPASVHDDQIDALSRAYAWFLQQSDGGAALAAPSIVFD
jgi:predicted phage terminase large subunit-like protein